MKLLNEAKAPTIERETSIDENPAGRLFSLGGRARTQTLQPLERVFGASKDIREQIQKTKKHGIIKLLTEERSQYQWGSVHLTEYYQILSSVYYERN